MCFMNIILIIELQFDLSSHTGQGIAKPKDDKIVLECLWLVEQNKTIIGELKSII